VLDQVFFSLDSDKFKKFTAMLDALPGPNAGLERLLAIKVPWCPGALAHCRGMRLRLSDPQPLTSAHRVDEFGCGEAALDESLKRRAMANQLSGASRTFVVLADENRVFGHYAMAAGAVLHPRATSGARRNMPDPVPVIVLARLAVDHRAQNIKPGSALLQDAVKRAVAVSQNAGVRALLVHALHDPRMPVLRTLRFSGVATASDDVDAVAEHSSGWMKRAT